MNNRVENGMLVKHVKFGLGKVVHTAGDRLYIVFRDQSERTARIFKNSFPGISLADVQSDSVLDHLPSLVQQGNDWVFPSERLSPTAAITAFLEQWPGGFSDAGYLEQERSIKEQSPALFAESLGNGQLGAFLEAGNVDELVARTKVLIEQANLLSSLEAAALFEVLDIGYAARSFFGALNELLNVEQDETDGRLEKAFRNYVNICAGLPQLGETRVFAWSNVTVLPFLAQPERHMFLKPVAIRRAAHMLAFELDYDSTPNWPTYARLLVFGDVWSEIIQDLGPKDRLDVQSFIYLSGGGYEV